MIYRDIEDGPRGLQTADFVGKQNLDTINSFLGGVSAYGGGDECEDIAGGLKVSLHMPGCESLPFSTKQLPARQYPVLL